MNVASAADFLVGALLVMMSLNVITLGIVAMNYIISRWWKPVRIFWPIETVEEYRNEHSKQPSRSKKDRVGAAGDQQQPNQN